jgi:hypothetical protein
VGGLRRIYRGQHAFGHHRRGAAERRAELRERWQSSARRMRAMYEHKTRVLQGQKQDLIAEVIRLAHPGQYLQVVDTSTDRNFQLMGTW